MNRSAFLNPDSSLRKRDYIEAVILLPGNLFYNITVSAVISVINKFEPNERRRQILFFQLEKKNNATKQKIYMKKGGFS